MVRLDYALTRSFVKVCVTSVLRELPRVDCFVSTCLDILMPIDRCAKPLYSAFYFGEVSLLSQEISIAPNGAGRGYHGHVFRSGRVQLSCYNEVDRGADMVRPGGFMDLRL